jgi:hypothetical protein
VDDREEPSPLYPAGVIMFDVGIIVGAHKTATIANEIQRELSKILEGLMEGHEFGMKDWGPGILPLQVQPYGSCLVYRVLIGRGTGGGCYGAERLHVHAATG